MSPEVHALIKAMEKDPNGTLRSEAVKFYSLAAQLRTQCETLSAVSPPISPATLATMESLANDVDSVAGKLLTLSRATPANS